MPEPSPEMWGMNVGCGSFAPFGDRGSRPPGVRNTVQGKATTEPNRTNPCVTKGWGGWLFTPYPSAFFFPFSAQSLPFYCFRGTRRVEEGWYPYPVCRALKRWRKYPFLLFPEKCLWAFPGRVSWGVKTSPRRRRTVSEDRWQSGWFLFPATKADNYHNDTG